MRCTEHLLHVADVMVDPMWYVVLPTQFEEPENTKTFLFCPDSNRYGYILGLIFVQLHFIVRFVNHLNENDWEKKL